MIAWRPEGLLISIQVTNYLPYPQLEALPVYLSFNTAFRQIIYFTFKIKFVSPKGNTTTVYLDNVARWARTPSKTRVVNNFLSFNSGILKLGTKKELVIL